MFLTKVGLIFLLCKNLYGITSKVNKIDQSKNQASSSSYHYQFSSRSQICKTLEAEYSFFLDAFSHLYKRVCRSVDRSVGPSVGWSVHRSVRHTRVEFLRIGPNLNKIATGIGKNATTKTFQRQVRGNFARTHLLSELCSTCFHQFPVPNSLNLEWNSMMHALNHNISFLDVVNVSEDGDGNNGSLSSHGGDHGGNHSIHLAAFELEHVESKSRSQNCAGSRGF